MMLTSTPKAGTIMAGIRKSTAVVNWLALGGSLGGGEYPSGSGQWFKQFFGILKGFLAVASGLLLLQFISHSPVSQFKHGTEGVSPVSLSTKLSPVSISMFIIF